MIRVVVVDDHQIVRDGLVALLGALDGLEVVGTAADGQGAVHVVGGDAAGRRGHGHPDAAARRDRGDAVHHGAARGRAGRHAHDERGRRHHPRGDAGGRERLPAQGRRRRGGRARHPLGGSWRDGVRGVPSLAGRVADFFSRMAAPARPAEVPFPELTERERQVLDRIAAGR